TKYKVQSTKCKVSTKCPGDEMRTTVALVLSGTFAVGLSGASAQADKPSATSKTSAPSKPWVTPKTPWGHPDLQGVWTTDDMLSIPMERPEQFAGRAELTDEEFEARAKRDQAALDRNRKAVG